MKQRLEYTHYGKDVRLIVGTGLFERLIRSHPKWVLLPIKEYNVYKILDADSDEAEYVLIVTNDSFQNISSERFERAYIFDEFPEDINLRFLISDVDGQRKGEKPMVMPSKCKVLADDSHRNAVRKIEKGDLFDEEKTVYEEIRRAVMQSVGADTVDCSNETLEEANARTKSQMGWVIAASALNLAGYGKLFFEHNDTSDIPEDDLNSLYKEFDRFNNWIFRKYVEERKRK